MDWRKLLAKRVNTLAGRAGIMIVLGAHVGKIAEKVYQLIVRDVALLPRQYELLLAWTAGFLFWLVVYFGWVFVEPDDVKGVE